MLQAFNVNECVLCEDIVHDGPWTSWILTCGPYFDLLTPLIYIVHISTYPYLIINSTYIWLALNHILSLTFDL